MPGYIKQVALLSLLLTALALLLRKFIYPEAPLFAMLVPAGMGAITLLIHRMMMKADTISPQRFLTAFMGGISVKMFAGLIALAIFLYSSDAMKAEVAIWFFMVYMTFTVFEVLWMQRYLRSGSKK